MEQIEGETPPGEINFEIIVRRAAEIEIIDAFIWYEEQQEDLGFEFLQLLDETFRFVKRNPGSYQIIYQNIRRALLRKFPYALFYIIENHQIIILGCFHQKRRPDGWMAK